jgi:hypothetical protein
VKEGGIDGCVVIVRPWWHGYERAARLILHSHELAPKLPRKGNIRLKRGRNIDDPMHYTFLDAHSQFSNHHNFIKN